MKLNALHLFLILLGSLMLCSILSNPVIEGMSGGTGRTHKDDKLYVSVDDFQNQLDDLTKYKKRDSDTEITINEYSTPNNYLSPRNEEHNIHTTTQQQQQQQLVDSANTNTNTNYHATNYFGSKNSRNNNNDNNDNNDDYDDYDDYDDDDSYTGGANEPAYNTTPISQIPAGSEDLYVLKSEIVPPVCPACPSQMHHVPRQEPAPPCPPCARCPEPAFECKKVPNYRVNDQDSLPRPVLADFSQFGM